MDASSPPVPFPNVERVNPAGTAPVVLVCDHAGLQLPEPYGRLGLHETELARHIGWDIGAAAVTRRMAELLDAPAVLSLYSRLLVDCNRAIDDPTFICEVSDGTVVPSNRGLDAAERQKRIDTFFTPYHAAIAEAVAAAQKVAPSPTLLSIHSFTPVMKGRARPWHVGILWDQDPRLAQPLIEILAEDGELVVGDNEPYSGRDGSGYTMKRHAEAAGFPHALVELRQDLVADADGVERWARRLSGAMTRILAEHGPFKVEKFI